MGVNKNLLELSIEIRLYSSIYRTKTYLLCFISSEKEVAMAKVDLPFDLCVHFGRLRLY